MHSNQLPVVLILICREDTFIYFKCLCIKLVFLVKQHTSVFVYKTLHSYSHKSCKKLYF